MRILLSALMWFCLTFEARGQQQPERVESATVISQQYLSAYQVLDIDALKKLYSAEARFIDPTSLNIPNLAQPFHWNGRDEILKGVSEWKKSVISLKYDIDKTFEASECVVFVGAVSAKVKTKQSTITYVYDIVTILTVKQGQVVEHRDYTNYKNVRVITQ